MRFEVEINAPIIPRQKTKYPGLLEDKYLRNKAQNMNNSPTIKFLSAITVTKVPLSQIENVW